jgi:TonB family protein
MDVSQEPSALPNDASSPHGAISATGWLGADGTFDHRDERKMGRAMTTSLVIHGALFALIVAMLSVVPQQVFNRIEPLEFKVAFVPDPGRGGGGGGSPAPAPPKKMEIPKTAPPVAVPVATPIPVELPPVPTLVAPIQTTTSTVLQTSGTNLISNAQYGGGGRGGGVGSGTGNGIGPGTGGGFGGGAYFPGNGVTWPTDIYQEKPKYTSDAMRNKIQGYVELEVVVLETGGVGEVRITKSLDRTYGLDQAAIEAARKWRFKPGLRQGIPVATRVTLQLEFRLH